MKKNKKQKNIAKNNFNKKLEIIKQECEDFGISFSDDIFSVGVIFDSLNTSQISYSLINSINELCSNYLGINFDIFVQSFCAPCIRPLCPIFDVSSIKEYNNIIIATSLSNLFDALNSKSEIIVYYMIDPFIINHKTIKENIESGRLKIILRSPSYNQILINNNLSPSDHSVENFNLKDIIKIIMEFKNEKNRINK